MDDFPIRFSFVEGIAAVKVDGELDSRTRTLLTAAIEELIARDRHQIVLDCHEIQLMSSAALGMLMTAVEKLESYGGSLKLADLHYRVANFLEAIRYPFLPPAYNTVDEAVASFLNGDSAAE